MAQFTPEQEEQLKILLGWTSDESHLVNADIRLDRPQQVIDRVMLLSDQLGQIDLMLTAALADSMAKTVGQLTLSYGQHVAHLKGEGTRLLGEISNLLRVPIVYNKYRDSSGVGQRWRGSGSSSVSYW